MSASMSWRDWLHTLRRAARSGISASQEEQTNDSTSAAVAATIESTIAPSLSNGVIGIQWTIDEASVQPGVSAYWDGELSRLLSEYDTERPPHPQTVLHKLGKLLILRTDDFYFAANPADTADPRSHNLSKLHSNSPCLANLLECSQKAVLTNQYAGPEVLDQYTEGQRVSHEVLLKVEELAVKLGSSVDEVQRTACDELVKRAHRTNGL